MKLQDLPFFMVGPAIYIIDRVEKNWDQNLKLNLDAFRSGPRQIRLQNLIV